MSGKMGRSEALALALAALVIVSLPSAAVADVRERPRVAAHGSLRAGVASPSRASVASAPVLAPWRSQATPTSFAFDAISRRGEHWPADPTGALGANWIVTAVNASYALYDLSGHAVIGPNAIDSLLRLPAGAEVADPKVVYDQYAGRFVLSYLAIDDALARSWAYVIAIPDATATDPRTWCATRVLADRTKGDGPQRPEDPALGYDETRVAMTMNMYGFAGDRFRGATVLAFPKSRLYDCSRDVAFDTFTGRETVAATGERGRTLQPAISVGHGRSLYLTSLEAGRPSFAILWRLSGTLGSMTLRSVPLRVPPLRPAHLGTQGGSTVDDEDAWWDAGGLRFTSTFSDLDAGRVYAAHTVAEDLAPDPGPEYVESVVRWYEIDPAGALGASRVLRAGTIGAPQTDAGWPSLATDATGNLFITYDRASAVTGEYLAAWIAEVVPGSTEATSRPLRIGTARFETTGGPEPWGETTAMSRDPVDGRYVMAVNQVAVSDGVGSTRDWRQIVHVVAHGS